MQNDIDIVEAKFCVQFVEIGLSGEGKQDQKINPRKAIEDLRSANFEAIAESIEAYSRKCTNPHGISAAEKLIENIQKQKKSELVDLQAQLDAANEKNEDLQANLKAAAEERETLQRNLDETSEENRQLTLDLGNLKYEYHAVQDNLEIAMREQYELQLKFDKDLKEAMENIQMVSVERDIALEDIRQKDNAIETLENEKKEELLRATAAVEQKGEEVKLKVKEIYDLKQKHDQEMKDAVDAREDLNQEIKRLKVLVADLQSSCYMKNEEIIRLESEKENLDNEKNAAMKAVEQKAEKISVMAKEMEDLKLATDKEIKALEANVADLLSSCTKKDEEIIRLESEKENLRNEKHAVILVKDDAVKQKNETIAEMVKKLDDQTLVTDKKIKEMEQSAADEKQALNDSIGKLQSKNDAKGQEIASLKDEIQKKVKEIEDLESKYDELATRCCGFAPNVLPKWSCTRSGPNP